MFLFFISLIGLIVSVIFTIFKKYLNYKMAKKSLEQIVNENVELGFDPDIIKMAYKNVNGDADRIIEQIFRLQQASSQFPTKPANAGDEDAQLSKAIEMSINEAKDKKISLEPLNPEQRIRKSGNPVGLKNIGNTCYFNSLLQTYFQNIELVRSVLSYRTPDRYRSGKKAVAEDEIEFKRKQASCKLVENLKILFANMIASDKRYCDPTDVITSITDDFGNEIPVGDQKDIGEFNLIFLSRIDEGLQLGLKDNSMENEKEEQKADSPSKIGTFGDDHEHRLSHRSSIKIEQNSLINQQFIGLMENSYTNESHNIHQSEDEQFSLLFVNVNNKELYKAIEEITIQHIDDYRNEKGEIVGVEKQSWIKKAPKTLFFQIDRVVFEKTTGQLKKINDEFDFPSQFHIDPFLLQNKDKALAVQKKVRKLRSEKEKYTNALKQLHKFGEKNLSLLDMLSSSISFFSNQKQQIEGEQETQNPTYFGSLSNKVKLQQIETLKLYEEEVRKRINNFQKKISSIEKEVEQCYSEMKKSNPYTLYSILVHEGSADSGHYYSYIYDINSKTWRKYNDINISEEAEAQVLKEARGVNVTSAYYLVYSQESCLNQEGLNGKLRNHELSTSDKYLKDFYSTLIPNQLKNKIGAENLQLYTEIEEYKMGSFANRVVDSYTKKFEICNESFRKAKWEKKKNSPPLLINLPLYLKSLGLDQQYKNSIAANAIQEYGPKDNSHNPIFIQLLRKKVTNFNDFKKPKNFQFDHNKHGEVFINNVFKARAAKKLFTSLKNEEYRGVFGLIKELKQGGDSSEYFEWLSNLVGKILMVTFLAEAELYLERKQLGQVLERLRLMLVLGVHFINRHEEKVLMNNCIFWSTEISIHLPEAEKAEVQNIKLILGSQTKQTPYDEIMLSNNANDLINQIKSSTDIQDCFWNLSRSENVYVDQLLAAREEVKGKMQAANEIYKQMKKRNIPLSKVEREQVIKRINK